jgi:GNAT superfamily N-acetyltransferase
MNDTHNLFKRSKSIIEHRELEKQMPRLDLANGYYDLPPGKMANVVTCLEMLAPPARKLADWPSHLILQRFEADDLEAFRDVFRKVGSDIMWFSRLIMTDEKLNSILTDPAVESYKLIQGNEVIGLLELDFREPDQAELSFFGLAPEAIGKGAGRALMDEALRRAWARPIKRFWVHTCTFDHPAALAFYIRSGFTPYQRMIEIHDDPRLTGKLPLDASPDIPII